MTETVTVFVSPGDPDCALVTAYLRDHDVEHTVRDVTTDPAASAVLFGRLGRVAVPTVQVGDRLLVGYDPLQLARFLPRAPAAEDHVSFGAAVRAVPPEVARAAGLPHAYGVEVGPVREGSAAAGAGVRPGDVITHIGAYTLHAGADQFRTAVTARRPGDTMQLTVRRGTDDLAVAVEFPAPPAPED